MDFSDPHKFVLKVSGAYLVGSPGGVGTPKTLLHLNNRRLQEEDSYFRLQYTTLYDKDGDSRNGVIEDAREPGRVVWSTPPVGFFNHSTRRKPFALIRTPSRQYRLGLTPDNTIVQDLTNKDILSLTTAVLHEDYDKLLQRSYPDIEDTVALLKGGWQGCAISRSCAIVRHQLGMFVLNIGGYSSCWFWDGKIQVVGSLERELIDKAIPIPTATLAAELRHAQ